MYFVDYGQIYGNTLKFSKINFRVKMRKFLNVVYHYHSLHHADNTYGANYFCTEKNGNIQFYISIFTDKPNQLVLKSRGQQSFDGKGQQINKKFSLTAINQKCMILYEIDFI